MTQLPLSLPEFNVWQDKSGLWNWCAKPPGADSVYTGFESRERATQDAIKFLWVPETHQINN